MNKIFIQGSWMLLSFFVVWFALSRINFINEDEVKEFANDSERRLGEMVLDAITSTSETVKNEKVRAAIDSIKSRICRSRAIDCAEIRIHIIRNSEINAFALPDKQIVIYTGLIEYVNNPEELAGVMAHEIGHIEKDHVMKKLVKEIGLEMLFAIAGGDAGFEIVRETGRVLSSGAFDRSQEREADEYAVEALAESEIDPQHLSNLFFRLAQQNNIPAELAWISSHPDSNERAADIIKKRKKLSVTSRTLLFTKWDTIKDFLRRDSAISESKSE